MDIRSASGLKPLERTDERVDVLVRVVRRERGADRRFDPESAKDWLRAVMTRADGDALLIEEAADLFRLLTVEDEGEDARLLQRGPDQREARHRLQRARGVL